MARFLAWIVVFGYGSALMLLGAGIYIGRLGVIDVIIVAALAICATIATVGMGTLDRLDALRDKEKNQ